MLVVSVFLLGLRLFPGRPSLIPDAPFFPSSLPTPLPSFHLLFERQSNRERGRQRARAKEICQPLVHSADACYSQCWAELMPGAWHSNQLSHIGCQRPKHLVLTCRLPEFASAGSWVGRGVAGTLIWDIAIPGSSVTSVPQHVLRCLIMVIFQ